MENVKQWKYSEPVNGVFEVSMASWSYFFQFLDSKKLSNYPNYIWRGQRDAAWPLESSLDRLMRQNAGTRKAELVKMHLQRIKQYACGRRGSSPPKIESDNDWWALGQHHGLYTPLLDWTKSPFVGLFFTFCSSKKSASGQRALWALHSGAVIRKSSEINMRGGLLSAPVEIFMPKQEDNSRLINQAGLFTKCDYGDSIDQWVKMHFDDEKESVLVKFIFPDTGRDECLKMLNRMNINYGTLFPDLHGASLHCNMAAEIDNYDMIC